MANFRSLKHFSPELRIKLYMRRTQKSKTPADNYLPSEERSHFRFLEESEACKTVVPHKISFTHIGTD